MIAVFALSLAASASAAEGWVQVRSKNFLVIGDAGERELRQTATRLEQFREAVRTLFPQIKLDGGIRTNVVVFKDAASYTPFKPKRDDGTADGLVRGYFQAGEDVNYIALAAGDKPGTYGTIYHEYVHFLLDVNIGRIDMPPWLGEGLAEYLETLLVGADGRVTLGLAPVGHMAILRKAEFIPFETFFATDNASLHRGVDQSRNLFYAQAWALTHYLLHSKTGGGEVGIENLLTSARSSEPPEKAAAKLFRANHADLAKGLREYIGQPAVPTRIVQPALKSTVDVAVTAGPLTEAQATAYLGDLLHHLGDLPRAETYLQKALKMDSALAVANTSLGLLLARRNNFVEARKHLEKAIAADGSNHYAHFNYAYALSQEIQDSRGYISEFPEGIEARMRASLKRAIELNPNFPESYRLLAFVNYVNDTNLDEALTLLKKGLTVKPGDQEITVLLAKVLLRQEKLDEARAIADRLAATATDSYVWNEATDVLRTVDQYLAVKAAGPNDPDRAKVFGPIPPLILKRSTLTEAEVARYNDERQITNLNLYIDRAGFGQKQVVGRIEKIACSDAEITYSVKAGGESFELTSKGFANVGMRVLTEGESSFTLDCGVSLAKHLTLLTFQPDPGARSRGRLIAISFVPDYFRLKTAAEMAARRTVIIEDDRVFRSRAGNSDRPGDPEE